VGVLIVVISVMKGFEIDFKKMVMGFEPHSVLTPLVTSEPEAETPTQYISNWRKVLEIVKKNPQTVNAAPYVEGMVFVESKNGQTPNAGYCLALPDKGAEALVDKLSKSFVGEGNRFDLSGDHVILNTATASAIGAQLNETVVIYASSNLKEVVRLIREAGDSEDEKKQAEAYQSIKGLILPMELKVVGIVDAATASERIYLPMHVGQEMFGLEDGVSGVGVELKQPLQASQFAQKMSDDPLINTGWYVSCWMDNHRERLAAIENERVMMYFVLSMILLVAAFSVMNTTITVTVQKRREIGIMTAMGARMGQIINIFVYQAVVTAMVGVILGVTAGGMVLYYRNDIRSFLASKFEVEIFAQNIYFLSEIPAHTEMVDIVIICSMTFLLCVLGALIPAVCAAWTQPAKALRD
jgi:lipoprotein-releasing system permease protein